VFESHGVVCEVISVGGHRIFRMVVCAAVAIAVVNSTNLGASAAASDGEGSLTVTVRDADTGVATRGVVKVLGPLSVTRATDAGGTLTLTGLPSGTYQVQVGAAGYKSSAGVAVELHPGERSTLTFDLARRQSTLPTIGRVTTTGKRPTSFTELRAPSTLRQLAENLDHAIGNLPGVDLNARSEDGRPQALYGLEGHDPTQTAMSLDGVPLNGPGTSFDGTLLASDLLASAAVSFGPAQGFTGGSIDYRTAAPTRDLVADFVGRAGPNGLSTLNALLRGSSGLLGYVVGATQTSSDSAFAGRHFVDWTGVASDHVGGSTQHGVLAKLQYLLGDSNVLTATMIRTVRTTQPICPLDTTVTPCGFGPASGNDGSSIATLRLLGSRDRWTYALSGFAVRRSSASDFSGRMIDGLPFPSTSFSESRFSGLSAHLEYRPDDHDRLGFTLSQTSNSALLGQTSLFDAPLALTSSDRTQTVGVDASHAFSSSTRAGLQLSERRDAIGTAITAGASLSTALSPRDALVLRFDASGAATSAASLTSLTTEPDFLNYTCDAPAAFGRVATVARQDGSTISARAAYTHTVRDSAFSVVAFDQVSHDVPFSYPINATSFSGLTFAAYLAAANRVFGLPGVCAQAHFQPSSLYLFGYLNGIDTRYRGVRVAASLASGSFRVDPYVSILRATLSSADAVVLDPNSFLRSGDQLLGIPYVQSGLVVDYKKRNIELATNARYFSRNNSLYRNGFVTLDFGAVFSAQHGAVTLRVTNVFDANARAFATVGTLLPRTLTGITVPAIGRPFDGRRFSADYSVPVGQRRSVDPTERSLVATQTSPPHVLSGLPVDPVREPFALRNTSPGCDFDTARRVERLIAPIRSYDEAYRRSGVSPSDLPHVAGTTIAGRSLPAGYELEISIQNISTLQAFFQCVSYRNVDEEDLHAAGFAGSATSYTGIPILFTSRFGFLVPTTKRQHVNPAYFQMGRAMPADPFVLTTTPSCTETYRARADVLLKEIRTQVRTHGLVEAASNDAFVTAVGTTADTDPWIYFDFKDPFDLAAVLNCGHISQGTRSQLVALRLGGAALPYLSFNATYGLYVYRP
jgi:hypothetical protein